MKGETMCRKRLILNVCSADRKELERIIDDENSSKRLVLRCKIILLTEKQIPLQEIADILQLSKATVNTWRQVYLAHGIEGLKAKKRLGRPSKIAKEIFSNLFPELVDNVSLPLRKALKIKAKSAHVQAKINTFCGVVTCGMLFLSPA